MDGFCRRQNWPKSKFKERLEPDAGGSNSKHGRAIFLHWVPVEIPELLELTQSAVQCCPCVNVCSAMPPGT
jgi:hypothetical protein